MKMKKMIYFMFALLFLSANSMNAQVAIGTTNPNLEPHTGAILDLSQVSGNKLGLLLPNVALTDAKVWAPVVGGTADEIDGMMVFNTSPTNSTASGLDGKGVYIWINGSWNKMGCIADDPGSDPGSNPDPSFTQGNPDVQTICYGATADFTLTAASGGSGAITYNWQHSSTGTDGSWTDAPGIRNGVNYTTPALTSNMYYRRQATAAVSGGTINSTGALVTVNQAFTQPNPAAVTICSGMKTTFTLAAASGGSGAITYNWQQRPNTTSDWVDATGTRDGVNYTTSTLTSDTYYRRQATAATCGGTINSDPVKVTVDLAFTQANPTPAEQTVCYGGTATFTTTAAIGGSGGKTYNWQQSSTGADGSWTNAPGTRNEAAYTTTSLYTDTYFRRQATCGCGTIESSIPAKVTVSQPNGEQVAGTNGFTYATYSYTGLGVWTENVKEAGYTLSTYTGHTEGERGYYYTWDIAEAVCAQLGNSTDWKVPTSAQWNNLKAYLTGGSASAAEKDFFMCGAGLAGVATNSTFSQWGTDSRMPLSGGANDLWTAWTNSTMNVAYTTGQPFRGSVRCVKSN